MRLKSANIALIWLANLLATSLGQLNFPKGQSERADQAKQLSGFLFSQEARRISTNQLPPTTAQAVPGQSFPGGLRENGLNEGLIRLGQSQALGGFSRGQSQGHQGQILSGIGLGQSQGQQGQSFFGGLGLGQGVPGLGQSQASFLPGSGGALGQGVIGLSRGQGQILPGVIQAAGGQGTPTSSEPHDVNDGSVIFGQKFGVQTSQDSSQVEPEIGSATLQTSSPSFLRASTLLNSGDETADTTLGIYYLTRYGYIAPSNSSAFSSQEAATELVNTAVKDFQAFAGLPLTGQLDPVTVQLMKTPRCGVKDPVGKSSHTRRKKRFALQGSRWTKRDLTWRIDKTSSTSSLHPQQIEAVFHQAFSMWAAVVPLTFRLESDYRSEVDISIRFEVYEHGDGDSFDGPGGTLAHAFFPQSGGDLHMDDAETWTIFSSQGTNMLQTVVHEIGHSLGLSHSNTKDSIMAPFYRGYDPNFKLEQDDIDAIQALYGYAEERPTPPTPSLENQLCSNNLKLDALVRTSDGTTYAFVGDQYWRLTQDSIASGFPRNISDWNGLPPNIDTGFTWPHSKSTFFFKDDLYWKYQNMEPVPGYPKPLSSGFPGIPAEGGMDAAFVWSGDGKIYFIRGKQYWKFDPSGNPFVRKDKYPASAYLWGVKEGLDTALQWDNGQTYFFKDNKYWRFDDIELQVSKASPPFPRPTGPWWFGCEDDFSRVVTK